MIGTNETTRSKAATMERGRKPTGALEHRALGNDDASATDPSAPGHRFPPTAGGDRDRVGGTLRRGARRGRRLLALPLAAAVAVLPAACGFSPDGAGGTATAQASSEPVRASEGMVASANGLASEVGRDVLAGGGNAVDAAVATGLALAAVHPSAGNIGGGGFMIVRFPDGGSTAFDFREKAPLEADSLMWLDEDGEYSSEKHHRSHLSVGVPGTVAGLALAHERYGTDDWERLVDPAVRLAADGFELTPALAGAFERVLSSMQDYPASVAKFTDENGENYAEGDLWIQPDLARTLERIRDRGPAGFYEGETARLIAEEMRRGGGLITEEDLARYEAKERTPIRGDYRGWDVISMAPPSSGGVALVEMLNILEGYDLAAMGHNSPEYVHHLAEAMRRAYRDRATFLADTDFVDVPIEQLTSDEHAASLRATIDPDRASVSSPDDVLEAALARAPESPQTTHFSVVDRDGMVVSVTYTLERGYGSKITVPGGGFLLNNEMGDFNPVPGETTAGGRIGTPPNLTRPEQRMLSSMTPTIIARDGELVAAIGSPGGRTIINTVLQLALNLATFDMNLQEAVDAPRLHHQWLPDELELEGDAATGSLVPALEAMGHTVDLGGSQGRAHAAAVDLRTGERLGAADARGPDAAAMGH